MPCYDGQDRVLTRSEIADLADYNKRLEAMLCMVLRTLEEENEIGHFRELFNYKEAGTDRANFDWWWSIHKRRDEERRRAEYEASLLAAERQKILEKLTPEERKLLGVE